MNAIDLEWHTNWPRTYATLAKKIILIPLSIAICVRGFSKRNAIKSHLRNIKLNLKTLETLMRVSILWASSGCKGLGYHLQQLEKHGRPKDTYAQLIEIFLQIYIYIYISKYCVTQN